MSRYFYEHAKKSPHKEGKRFLLGISGVDTFPSTHLVIAQDYTSTRDFYDRLQQSLRTQTSLSSAERYKQPLHHTLYTALTGRLSTFVPFTIVLLLTAVVMKSKLNSLCLICIAPDLQCYSAPQGYQSKGRSKLSVTNSSLTLRNISERN